MQRTDSWTSNKTIKLRSACDHCHTSKVRCSGEKERCRRCRTLNHQCVYSESRVGKVASIRNRNKRVRTASEQPGSLSPAPSELSMRTQESSKEPIHEQPDFPLCDDSFIDWTYANDSNEASFFDFQESDSSLAHMSNQPSLNFPPPCPSDFDFSVPTLNFNCDGLQTPPPSNDYENVPSSASYTKLITTLHRQNYGLLNPPTPKDYPKLTSFSAPPTRSASPAHSDLQPAKLTSPRGCISACHEIIEHLDFQIHSDLTALGAVMRVNQTAASELARILSLPECRASASCPLLICIAIDQIVTLFECSIRSNEGLPSAANLHVLPDLRLGFFQVDANEMIALRAHIITKELRRSLQVLDTLAQALRNPALRSVPSVGLHKQWAADMTQRLGGLVNAVGGWKRDCIAGLGKG